MSNSTVEQFVALVVGLFCIAAMAYVALFAIGSGWLMLFLGLMLLALALAVARRGVPRPLVSATLVFGVALPPVCVFLLLT